jgi:hypothetical protein
MIMSEVAADQITVVQVDTSQLPPNVMKLPVCTVTH